MHQTGNKYQHFLQVEEMKRRKLTFLLTYMLLLSTLFLLPAQSGEPPWVQTNGPEGGLIIAIEIDRVHPNTLYAGGAGGGVFKSTDSGTTWTMLQQIVPPSEQIWDILVSPDDPQTVYALAAGRLYKSTDGGESWRVIDSKPGFRCVKMDPTDSQAILIGTWEGKVYHTADGGTSWRNITSNLPGDRIADVAIGAKDEFWAGTFNHGTDKDNGGRLYHTINGGISWDEINIGQRVDTDIRTIFVDPENRSIVYVGLAHLYNEMFDSENDNYLLKTTNGGTTWMPLRIPGPCGAVDIMGRDLTDDTIYVSTGEDVYKSNNGGRSWTFIGPPGQNGEMRDIAVDPHNNDVLYLPRRSYGIVKSTNGGATWTPINQGLPNVRVSLLAIPNVPGSGIVYATAHGEATFKTNDWGNSWTCLNEGGLKGICSDELVVNPHEPEEVWYVVGTGDVLQTTDGGATWAKIIDPRPGGSGFRFSSVYALTPALSDSDIIYSLANGFGIFKTNDGGESWRFLRESEVDYTYSIAVHPTNPDIVYSGYLPKPFQDWAMVRRTFDGGDSWDTALHVPQSRGITSVVIDPTNPHTVYAGSIGNRGQIYKSSDRGNSWSKLNEHFTMCTVWGQPQLIIDPDDPLTAYAATWLAGTWKTTDAGATWELLEEAPISSTALSLNKLNSRVIYSADRTKPKIWKSTDAGLTWKETADFSSDGAFLVNRVLADGNTLYASTFGPTLHGGKLYKSINSVSSWIDITGDLPRSVLDLAVDPTNPDIVYVTTHIHGAYKSINGGTTWAQLQNFPDIGAYDIEVDPLDSTIIYACGLGGCSVPNWCMPPEGYTFTDDAGVYKSDDSGSTWRKILTTKNECRAIRIYPSNHNILFAAAMDDGLQVSTNGGSSWTSYNEGLCTYVLTSCAVGGNKIYVGSQACGVHSGNINKSNWSVRWQQDRSNKPVPEVYSLEIKVDPTNSNRIFVGANPGGLYRSDDGGATFYDKNFLTPSVVVDDPFRQGYYTFAIDPTNTKEVWLGTWGKGIYKSYDAMDFDIGANGTDMKMYGKHINQILIQHRGRFTIIYVATEEGVFESTDGGTTWHDISIGLETRQIRTLATTAGGTLLCSTLGYELYYYDTSHSRYHRWQQMHGFRKFGPPWPIWNNRVMYQYSTILFHPTDPDIIYFGTFPAGIYKSTDGGHRWRESNVGWTNDGVFCLVSHPEDTNIIYAGTYNGVNRSTDGAAHWEIWDNGWPAEQWVFSIDLDPRNPDVMYACSKNGENEGTGREGFHGTVMKSTNGGASWFKITTGLDINQEFYKIIVDRYNPDTIYLATERNGVFISRNGGKFWQSWNDGLTNLAAGTNGDNVTNTMALSSDGRYIYFGTAGSGVFRRPTPYSYIEDFRNSPDSLSPTVGNKQQFGGLERGQ